MLRHGPRRSIASWSFDELDTGETWMPNSLHPRNYFNRRCYILDYFILILSFAVSTSHTSVDESRNEPDFIFDFLFLTM